MPGLDNMKISVVMPVYNERENITDCVIRLHGSLKNLSSAYEIICVDDGSTDGTSDILRDLALRDQKLKIIQFRKNYGQTAAIAAGFDFACGEIVVTMDADLQNQPEDIPRMISAISKDCDVVCGWRKQRKDKFITRRIPSYIANKIISGVTGVKLHDYGCTLRVYKREFIKEVKIYGEMHRFLPALLSWIGASIIEVEVDHAPRMRGKSKYGIFRIFKVILDLTTVKLLTHYSTKPIYMFGGIGLILFLIGLATFFVVCYRVIFLHILSATPLIFVMVIFFIASIQVILAGLLAEINVRTFFETNNKQAYNIKDKINI